MFLTLPAIMPLLFIYVFRLQFMQYFSSGLLLAEVVDQKKKLNDRGEKNRMSKLVDYY